MKALFPTVLCPIILQLQFRFTEYYQLTSPRLVFVCLYRIAAIASFQQDFAKIYSARILADMSTYRVQIPI